MRFYSATFSDGTRITRATDRVYSHAWLMKVPARPKTADEVKAWSRYGDDSPDWKARFNTGFSGRADLARGNGSNEPGATLEVVPVVEHPTRKAMKGGAA